MPSTYAVLGYSPHTVLLGRGFPPRLPHGELHFIWHFIITLFITFFLTFPQRGVRRAIAYTPPTSKYFNPRTPCGVRRPGPGGAAAVRFISIHAPLTGCDLPPTAPSDGWGRHFNPRTPCGVRPAAHCSVRWLGTTFQSTHPLRGATRSFIDPGRPPGNFNPRTPCGVRLFRTWHSSRHCLIFNPRTPCGVRRGSSVTPTTPLPHFNPRTPCGVRRAPRSACSCLRHFNPRTPCGVRRQCSGRLHGHRHFNPRTPCGVRRPAGSAVIEGIVISIHAPLAGCDEARALNAGAHKDFNPRTPCGVRRPGQL